MVSKVILSKKDLLTMCCSEISLISTESSPKEAFSLGDLQIAHVDEADKNIDYLSDTVVDATLQKVENLWNHRFWTESSSSSEILSNKDRSGVVYVCHLTCYYRNIREESRVRQQIKRGKEFLEKMQIRFAGRKRQIVRIVCFMGICHNHHWYLAVYLSWSKSVFLLDSMLDRNVSWSSIELEGTSNIYIPDDIKSALKLGTGFVDSLETYVLENWNESSFSSKDLGSFFPSHGDQWTANLCSFRQGQADLMSCGLYVCWCAIGILGFDENTLYQTSEQNLCQILRNIYLPRANEDTDFNATVQVRYYLVRWLFEPVAKDPPKLNFEERHTALHDDKQIHGRKNSLSSPSSVSCLQELDTVTLFCGQDRNSIRLHMRRVGRADDGGGINIGIKAKKRNISIWNEEAENAVRQYEIHPWKKSHCTTLRNGFFHFLQDAAPCIFANGTSKIRQIADLSILHPWGESLFPVYHFIEAVLKQELSIDRKNNNKSTKAQRKFTIYLVSTAIEPFWRYLTLHGSLVVPFKDHHMHDETCNDFSESLSLLNLADETNPAFPGSEETVIQQMLRDLSIFNWRTETLLRTLLGPNQEISVHVNILHPEHLGDLLISIPKPLVDPTPLPTEISFENVRQKSRKVSEDSVLICLYGPYLCDLYARSRSPGNTANCRMYQSNEEVLQALIYDLGCTADLRVSLRTFGVKVLDLTVVLMTPPDSPSTGDSGFSETIRRTFSNCSSGNRNIGREVFFMSAGLDRLAPFSLLNPAAMTLPASETQRENHFPAATLSHFLMEDTKRIQDAAHWSDMAFGDGKRTGNSVGIIVDKRGQLGLPSKRQKTSDGQLLSDCEYIDEHYRPSNQWSKNRRKGPQFTSGLKSTPARSLKVYHERLQTVIRWSKSGIQSKNGEDECNLLLLFSRISELLHLCTWTSYRDHLIFRKEKKRKEIVENTSPRFLMNNYEMSDGNFANKHKRPSKGMASRLKTSPLVFADNLFRSDSARNPETCEGEQLSSDIVDRFFWPLVHHWEAL